MPSRPIGLALVPVATRSGDKLEERLNAGGVVAQQIEDHEDMAQAASSGRRWPCGWSPWRCSSWTAQGRAGATDDGARRPRGRGRAGRGRGQVAHRRSPRVDGGLEVHHRSSLPVAERGQSSSSARPRLRSSRRSEASRAGSLCPAATQSSSAHSGSSWLHARGQSAVPRLQVGEGVDDPVEVDVGQPEAAHARGVDDPAAAGQLERDAPRSRCAGRGRSPR